MSSHPFLLGNRRCFQGRRRRPRRCESLGRRNRRSRLPPRHYHSRVFPHLSLKFHVIIIALHLFYLPAARMASSSDSSSL